MIFVQNFSLRLYPTMIFVQIFPLRLNPTTFLRKSVPFAYPNKSPCAKLSWTKPKPSYDDRFNCWPLPWISNLWYYQKVWPNAWRWPWDYFRWRECRGDRWKKRNKIGGKPTASFRDTRLATSRRGWGGPAQGCNFQKKILLIGHRKIKKTAWHKN